jgi:uncharacterized alkaline shock family protein YloU
MKSTEKVNNTSFAGQVAPGMMQTGDAGSELGIIKIHDNVLASLVGRAVLSVNGVSRLAGSAIIDNLAGIVGSHSRAIEIVKEGDDKIKFTVKVNICFGTVIPKVATEIQRQVIEQVEKAVGIPVASVDVIVQQLDDPEEEDSVQNSVNGVKVEALAHKLDMTSLS